MALLFGFKLEMGVKGFWLGFLLALVCLDVFVAYLVIFADWKPKITAEPEEVSENDREKNLMSGINETQ